MAATATLASILTNTSLSSLVWSSTYRRTLLSPVRLVCRLASNHFWTENYQKNSNFITWDSRARSRYRSFRCQSTASSNVNSTPDSVSSNGFRRYGRLLPCPSENGPPRVEHLVVKEGGPVLDYISNSLDLPPLFVADLIHFGAVYYALVCPKPPPSATPEQIKTYKEVTAPSVLKNRASIKGKTVREAQKTYRITRADEFVEAGTYLRVHVHPKRFPRCYEIDWRSRIVAITESYVILDKPAGTSVGGTTDNIEESCATFATRALGLTSPLMTTHQIDNCTEGCVVLARTKDYCSVFHGKIREKKVKKLYLALAAAPVPVGVITHYMRPINIAPRLVSEESVDGWHLCQLEVLECKKVAWPTSMTERRYSIEDCGWPPQDFAYECKVNLLTGRTHQIRAQLAACGAPIVGDSMYLPAAVAEIVNPRLNPFRKNSKKYANETDKAQAIEEWIAQHGKEPAVAIGLQACQILWDNGEHFYEAGTPWWR
ncbi:RNA pseudouridine synthase 6, chloroplastic [Coffea arabica]|uniref:RNA pseudouridine synthase 6, chloroplastic n=1 Tax=Coffea arabica TaxID=13443 RepID=A0A6P6U5F7_COFAR|nr:RNA pseudouridine synthase 6, chloroplastic-like [Coffea arabica]XP_027087742.1 RNA pseudouridine synthase 6, chloroplastic [Coffea arabica]